MVLLGVFKLVQYNNLFNLRPFVAEIVNSVM